MKKLFLRKYETKNMILIVNLILGVMLWLGTFTNIEWHNIWANVVFPLVVGLIGLISLIYSKKNYPGTKCGYFYLPSITGGMLSLFFKVVFLLPPFLLATMFWMYEQADSTIIQTEFSPDKTRVAEVHFFPVGAYSGGNGRIRVYVKNKWLPLVRREVFYLRVSHAGEDTENYLNWKDNQTLYINEIDYELEIDWIEFKPPELVFSFQILLYLIQE